MWKSSHVEHLDKDCRDHKDCQPYHPKLTVQHSDHVNIHFQNVFPNLHSIDFLVIQFLVLRFPVLGFLLLAIMVLATFGNDIGIKKHFHHWWRDFTSPFMSQDKIWIQNMVATITRKKFSYTYNFCMFIMLNCSTRRTTSTSSRDMYMGVFFVN